MNRRGRVEIGDDETLFRGIPLVPASWYARVRAIAAADAFGAEAQSIRRSRPILLGLLTPSYKHAI
jgi:hypothetical protein